MQNWCLNALHASGEPEAVEEFRILNAQFSVRWTDMDQKRVPHEKQPSAALVGIRPLGDIAFNALCPGQDWGTQWDVSGDAEYKIIDRGVWSLPHGEQMGRLHVWFFDTPWGPPSDWMHDLAPRFPDLALHLGYRESSNGVFGVFSCHAHNCANAVFEYESSKPLTKAASYARRDMPKHRRPDDLLQAIWIDDVQAVKNKLRHADPDFHDQTRSSWTALMHAARAGSTNVFQALLAAGADPRQGSKDLPHQRRFTVMDVLLDVYPHQAVELVQARAQMLETVLTSYPDLAQQTLGSGASPASMAVRYEIQHAIRALLPLHSLAREPGIHGGIADVCITHVENPATFVQLIECAAVEDKPILANQIARKIVRSAVKENSRLHADVFLLMHQHHALDQRVLAQAAGKELVVGIEEPKLVNADFAAYINAALALQAIDTSRDLGQGLKPLA